MGDFNNVLNLEDRMGCSVTLAEVVRFRQCIRDCNVHDMGMSGPFLTWSKVLVGSSQR